MNIVSFGGGTNSTAMIIGMYEREIPIDLILFADTGAEMPETYSHIRIMNKWLFEHEMPQITIVEKMDFKGDRLTLETECLNKKILPAQAYGFKQCSIKHKQEPQEKFCNNYKPCLDVWEKGEKINKYIGFDAGEENRVFNAMTLNLSDKKYNNVYALLDWGWYREDCIETIKGQGFPLPGKSSCFFCPAMKKPEVLGLKLKHRDLFDRAITIEKNAMPNLQTVKGLGRDFAWSIYFKRDDVQIPMCELQDDDSGMPCGCYDG